MCDNDTIDNKATEIYVEIGINTLQKEYFKDSKQMYLVGKICRELKIHYNFYIGKYSFLSSWYSILCEESKADLLLKRLNDINIKYDKLIYHDDIFL